MGKAYTKLEVFLQDDKHESEETANGSFKKCTFLAKIDWEQTEKSTFEENFCLLSKLCDMIFTFFTVMRIHKLTI